MKVRSRLVLAFSYLVVTLLVALTIPLLFSLRDRARAEKEREVLTSVQAIAAGLDGQNLVAGPKLDRLITRYALQVDGRVIVMNRNGKVLADSDASGVGRNYDTGQRPEIQAALDPVDPRAEVLRRFSDTEQAEIMVAAAPVIDEGLIGAVRITKNIQDVNDAVRDTTIGLVTVIGGTGLVIGMVIAVAMSGAIARPLTRLAEAARRLGIGLAVGSQRAALESDGAPGLDMALRLKAPDTPILANIGAAQLTRGFGVDEARRVLDMIAADALIVHLNPLQEACQPEGDRDWWGVGAALEALVKALDAPVLVKETGAGMSAATAKRLLAMGVAAVDVAGAGGSNWATVEGERSEGEADKAHAAAFADWGIPTARAIAEVRAACPKATIIGSGGVRDGVEAAKAIRLGADMVGQAAGVLAAATVSTEAVVEHFQTVIRQMRTVCFCTGSANLTALRKAPLQG